MRGKTLEKAKIRGPARFIPRNIKKGQVVTLPGGQKYVITESGAWVKYSKWEKRQRELFLKAERALKERG